MGALPPKPPEFSALGESKGAEKRRTEAKASAPPSSPHLGAQVALQQGLILRVGKPDHNIHKSLIKVANKGRKGGSNCRWTGKIVDADREF